MRYYCMGFLIWNKVLVICIGFKSAISTSTTSAGYFHWKYRFVISSQTISIYMFGFFCTFPLWKISSKRIEHRLWIWILIGYMDSWLPCVRLCPGHAVTACIDKKLIIYNKPLTQSKSWCFDKTMIIFLL